MYGPEFERYWLGIHVQPEARRRGLGTALWTACSAIARQDGKTGLQCDVSEQRPDGVAFLEHRGFEAIERAKMVQLDLRGLEPPAIEPPAGIVLTTLAERPDLEAGAHAVAVEAYLDIPSADEPLAAGSFDEFVARDVRRESIPPDGFMIALDSDTGEVAGWASLMYLPAPRRPPGTT